MATAARAGPPGWITASGQGCRWAWSFLPGLLSEVAIPTIGEKKVSWEEL